MALSSLQHKRVFVDPACPDAATIAQQLGVSEFGLDLVSTAPSSDYVHVLPPSMAQVHLNRFQYVFPSICVQAALASLVGKPRTQFIGSRSFAFCLCSSCVPASSVFETESKSHSISRTATRLEDFTTLFRNLVICCTGIRQEEKVSTNNTTKRTPKSSDNIIQCTGHCGGDGSFDGRRLSSRFHARGHAPARC